MIGVQDFFKYIIVICATHTIVKAQLKSCSQYPCQNGGRCINQPNTFYGYSCVCIPPWSGVNCDQNRNTGNRLDINQNRNPGVDQYGNNQYGNVPYGNNQYGNVPYGNNQYGNNQYGNNQYGNNGYDSNRFGSQGGSNIVIGNNPNPFDNNGGSNIYINNNNPYDSPGTGSCLMRPCRNGGYCQPGLTQNHFKCLCRANYYGTHCEYYRQPKGALLGIILGTILPFFGIVIITSIIVYCCCCKK